VDVGGRIMVAKVFPSDARDRLENERDMLKRCRDAGVPAPYSISVLQNAILMEFIDGINLSSLFDSVMTSPEAKDGLTGYPRQELIDGLASWLAQFHHSFGFKMCRGDSILKNFIVSRKKVYGIDFEESGEGDPIKDVGQVCSYALSTDPAFTEAKFQFCEDLAARYWKIVGRDRSSELPEAIAQGLEHYAPYRSDRRRLLEGAEKLRKEGMPLHRPE
jgi:aminoglycoside phosphotransferase (APT) family kinase protein